MKFVKVDKLPEKRQKKRLVEFLNEFMVSNIKVAKIELKPDDYKNAQVRRRCLKVAIKREALPIKVTKIDDEVFFIRTDM